MTRVAAFSSLRLAFTYTPSTQRKELSVDAARRLARTIEAVLVQADQCGVLEDIHVRRRRAPPPRSRQPEIRK